MMSKQESPFSQLHNAEQQSMPDAINVTPENPLLEVFKFIGGFTGIVVVLYLLCIYGVASLVPLIPPKDEGIFSPIALEFLKGKKTNPDMEKALHLILTGCCGLSQTFTVRNYPLNCTCWMKTN